jgi:hypothetical protein
LGEQGTTGLRTGTGGKRVDEEKKTAGREQRREGGRGGAAGAGKDKEVEPEIRGEKGGAEGPGRGYVFLSFLFTP